MVLIDIDIDLKAKVSGFHNVIGCEWRPSESSFVAAEAGFGVQMIKVTDSEISSSFAATDEANNEIELSGAKAFNSTSLQLGFGTRF